MILPALSISSSRVSKAARTVLYISGKDTTAAARTVACQEKIIGNPTLMKNCPTGELRPKIIKRKKPTTVGGRTIGSVKIASRRFLVESFTRAVIQAARIEKMITKIIAVEAVFSETKSGRQSNVEKN